MKNKQYKKSTLLLSMIMLSSPLLAADYDQHWAKDAITKWKQYEIVKGYENGDFKPNGIITRAEFAAILQRTFNLPLIQSGKNYIDLVAAPHKWYVSAAERVISWELMYLPGVFFEPEQPITREEAAYALWKAYQVKPQEAPEKSYKDQEQISSWAIEGVKALSSWDYMQGTPEGKFMPQGTLTRAEVVTMLQNLTSHLIYQPGVYEDELTGNVLINTSGVTLKNLTIEGNLYIGPGVETVQLENLEVKGTVYLQGGKVTMSGNYDQVIVTTLETIDFTKGHIKTLEGETVGGKLILGEEASVGNLTQDKPIHITGGGSIGGVQADQIITPELKRVSIGINNQLIALPIRNNEVIIDLPALSQQFAASDTLTGIIMESNDKENKLKSSRGSMAMETTYSWQEMEQEMGFIREVALGVGLSPTLVIHKVLGEGPLTIGKLLANYEEGKKLAAEEGYPLEERYTFKRYLANEQGHTTTINVTLKLQ